MNHDRQLWVTGYHAPDHEVLVTQHPRYGTPLVFSLTQEVGVRVLRREALDAVRASGIQPTFYSIPNPF